MQESVRNAEIVRFGTGCYTVPEAARLLGTMPRTISRWLGGYSYRDGRGDAIRSSPLWRVQLPRHDDHLELGFHDLIELRFVLAFLKHGLGLNVVRRCLENAQKIIGEERPFSTYRFRTDGRSVFLDSIQEFHEMQAGTNSSITDLRNGQMVFRLVVEPTFRDLDLSDGSVVQWRPYKGKQTIVIDPNRAFGKPLAADFGAPTSALATAVKAEGSAKRAATLFEVPIAVVNDAVAFERSLMAA